MFEAKIITGMKWLDLHYPGWIDKVNLDILNIRSCGLCIIGQVIGVEECKILAEKPFPFVKRGFMTPSYSREYDTLTEEWKQAILKRRAEHVKVVSSAS